MILKLDKNKLFFKNYFQKYFQKIVIFGFVFGIFLSSANFAEAAQFGRPASTVSAGSWTAVGAPQLWQTVDEATPNDDTDYAEATVNTTAEFLLSSVPDPGVSTGHIVRWRYQPNGAGTGENIYVDLYQGSTLIRSSGKITGSRGQYNDASFTLTGAEADSITDYSDLRLRIITDNLGGGDSIRVTWLEFEVTDNTSPSLSISEPDGVNNSVTVGDPYNITYTLSDPEEAVTAAFYYDTDATGLDGIAITGPCASASEGSGVTCAWDTTGISPGSYYVYGITSDSVNPQVSAYSLGTITINIEVHQEILNKLDTLETKVDTLQTQVDQMPQSVWEYTNRSLTDFGTLVADIWSYSGRSLDNISNITQGVWEYSTRSLTSFGTLVADIWSYSGRSLDNVSNITQGVWEYSTRTLTSGTSIAQDIWNATTRKLTSREITVGEYLAGVTESGTVSQVADQPTQANVEYNVELVRKATFDFAGVADGGSTLTLVDAELDQPNAYWDNYDLVIMSGANIGQKRAISSFDKNTNAITLASALPFSIASGDQYVISHEGKLVNAIWSYADRTLTGFGTLVADIWSYPNRTLTSFGTLAADIWGNTTRTLTSALLGGGGQLATTADLDTLKSDLIAEINENQTLISALNNITAADVWSYGTRGLTESVDLANPQQVWDVAKANLTAAGSVGEQIANNLDVVVSTRASQSSVDALNDITAADVWSVATRTLTSNANFNDPDSATIAAAVWSEATRELTSYGNDITAADVWNILSANLTTTGTIGKQLAEGVDVAVSTRASQASLDALNNISATEVWSYATRGLTENVDLTSSSTDAIWEYALTQIGDTGSIGKLLKDNIDASISSRSTLTAADVWSESTRTLTDYATSSISLAVWTEATRELTNYGNNITAQDVWNVLSNTLTLQDSIGKQLAGNVDVAVSTRASQASIDALNNISATDVWSYANRSITDPDAIWEYALTQIGDAGSIGTLIKNNLDATISSRGTSNLTAADVWNEATRTLTSNANFNDPDSATIAAAVWSEATRELTSYGNDITAADVWNILSANLTTTGTIGKQLAANVDAAVSTRSTLTAADVWGYANRTLTDFGTLVADIWSYSTRSLTTFGTLAADIWNNSTRTLTSALLGGGGQLATQADVTAAKNEIITLINALNNISSADVWAYSNRSLTDPDTIWEYALTQIGDAGSIGMLLKDNIDATISSRATSTITAADVWNASVRTLTANTNLGISTTAEIADAIWDEAIADHATEGSTGAALSTASTGGGGGAAGLTIETHTVSEFESGDTAAAATIQVKRNGVPVSGVTPTGVYYDPSNNAKTWPGEGGSTVNFTEIGTTGIYTHSFDTTGAALGVYKLAVSAAQSTGGSNYSENFETGTVGLDMPGWVNTGATYSVGSSTSPHFNIYRKTDYGGFIYAYPTAVVGLADFTYQADVYLPSNDWLIPANLANSDFVGISFRFSDPANTYDLYLRRAAGNIRLRKNGVTLQETALGSLTINKNTWYTLKVVVTGGNIKAYVDNVLQIDYTDATPLPEGRIALFAFNSIAAWDNIVVTTAGSSETAYIAKDFAIVSPKSTQASINALNNIAAIDVWNVATSSLTTAGSIGKAFADNRIVHFAQDGQLLAGSGTNNYRAKLYLYDLSSQPVNAVSAPSITIKNAVGGTFETGVMDDYTGTGDGIYEFITTIGAGQGPGRWETIVSVDTGGTNPIIISGYFEVEASPARVTINSITDDTVPSITANFSIANEGTLGFEYPYEYCVVDTIANTCGGGDDIAYGLSAEFIEPGVEEQFNKTLTVNNTGTYYYKVAVYWGTERSVAVLQFDAVSEEAPPPPPGGGGGGGGGGPAPAPTPTPAVCSGADFNHDGIVDSVDFSILLYFWKTQPPFRNACVDINKDAQVNSVDFSILLYQWGKPGVNIK